MVRIKFSARPRTPVVSPRFSPMASEDAGDVSVGHRGSSAEQLDTSLADDHNVALTEATSEQDAGSDEENLSEDTSDSRNDVVEEFLASGLWPFGQQFGFQVERKEFPLSKVVVLMPLITTVPLSGNESSWPSLWRASRMS
jgi:hypothetical protein